MILEVIHKGQVIQTLELFDGQYKIGRAANCDIRLRASGVSKQHANLLVKGESAAIMDLGSSNGTFVNGILVRKHTLENNDEIVIVDYHLRVKTGNTGAGFLRVEPTF